MRNQKFRFSWGTQKTFLGWRRIKLLMRSSQIRNPRGLSDLKLEQLMSGLRSRCSELLGDPVIFELIEICREFLTDNNVPACQCAICLMDIADGDDFVKTDCYHYFHSLCLGRYAESARNQFEDFRRDNPAVPGTAPSEEDQFSLVCPVCREKISDARTETWLAAERPILESMLDDFVITPELAETQRRMERLYLKQKAKGGIINVEEEEKQFLVLTDAEGNASNGSSSSNNECSALPTTNDDPRKGTTTTTGPQRQTPEAKKQV